MMNLRALTLLLVASVGTHTASAASGLRLAPLFTDNMVLQQATRAPIWGTGDAGTTVRVAASWGSRATTTVGADGWWSVELATPSAGGPFDLNVTLGDSTCVLRNVLVGEVWLCSGQSNMEMPMAGWPPTDTIMNSAEEIQASDFPNIRLFTVARAYAVQPSTNCEGSWAASSPSTTPAFSATAYFFGRMLHKELGIPIGLIHSSWGGTPIESWMSIDTLARMEEHSGIRANLDATVAGMEKLEAWRQNFPTLSVANRPAGEQWKNLDFKDGRCASVEYPDGAWRTMTLPRAWETSELGEFDGAVWFRKRVTIPAAWVGRALTLELGPIDDVDMTHVNGQLVGAHEAGGMWKVDRIYDVPASLVMDTVMTIAIRVIDFQGGGGIFGRPESLRIRPESGQEAVSLAGPWLYLPVAEYRAQTFVVFGSDGEAFEARPEMSQQFSAHSPTSLFNGMIHPLMPYRVRGAIWYQGEENTGKPEAYQKLLEALIGNWRDTFRSPGMPFYYAQIAPYAYDPPTRSELLREAQLQCMNVENTGMAVTLDIGDARNIHPANKQEVGRRLARWALAKTYGKDIPYSGPLYRSMTIERDKIILAFDHAGERLVLRDNPAGTGFRIAGSDRVFRDARVEVRGTSLAVWHPEVRDPEAVRYAFSNTPPATLFNAAGLPAPSFRTDSWIP